MGKLDRYKIRQIVYKKCCGHCAYCGCEITLDTMQVDHIEPRYRGSTDTQLANRGIQRGDWRIDNLNPACAVCNKWKNTFTVEEFRVEIMMQLDRIKRDSAGVRMCLKYGLLSFTPHDIKFYFELHPPFGIKGLAVVNG